MIFCSSLTVIRQDYGLPLFVFLIGFLIGNFMILTIIQYFMVGDFISKKITNL